MPLQKPKRLHKGDKIAIVSPSGCAGALFPHRIERGVAALKDLGFEVELYPTVSKNYLGSAGTPQERVADLHRAFEDKTVKAIMASTGGFSLNEVLPLLDYALIEENPKIFCGFSDNTLLHFALGKQANLLSFYGPGLMHQFGEYPNPLPYSVESFISALMSDEPQNILPSSHWTDETPNWFEKADLAGPRNLYPNSNGHTWMREGKCTAPIIVGCLQSLIQINGSKYAQDYSNKILVIDFSEGVDHFAKGFPLQFVATQLADLAMAGIFSKISALAFGRAFGYTTEERKELVQVIKRQTKGYDFPILDNVNVGHADPILTLPQSVMCELDSQKNIFRLLESGII